MKKFNELFILVWLVFIGQAKGQNLKKYQNSKLTHTGFYQNKGQITDQNYKPNPTVKYLLCSRGFNVQLRQTGFSYDTYTDSVDSNQSSVVGGQLSVNSCQRPRASHARSVSASVPSSQGSVVRPGKFQTPPDVIRRYHRVDITLVGCNSHAQIIAEGQSTTYYNYFTAGTPKGGVSKVHTYQKVTYKNIYPNIDLVFYASSSSAKKTPVEYNFIVHPGGKVSDIKLQYKGENKISLVNNQLTVNVNAGDFSESIPTSYIQESKQPVAVNYRAIPCPPAGGQGGVVYGFNIKCLTFNIKHSTLIIDPTPNLAWGTYYGGAGYDEAYGGIALDTSDNVYIVGTTESTTNIATVGAYQTVLGGGGDAFVAKFNPTGTSLLWGTYYGGAGGDNGTNITLDATDNIYITGYTSSTSNIATVGAYQTTYGGGTSDAFVAKFSSTGTSLLWGTYYGGSGNYDYGYGIALDASNNVYVSGWAGSTGMATVGAYQTVFGGGYDAFVAKFNPSGATLLWGTYFGGAGADDAQAIALDASNNVYITGYLSSPGLATPGAYQTTWSGFFSDVYVAKFNPTGSSLLWCTYYGGSSGNDYGLGIAVDAANNVYVCGGTETNSGMATAGAYQTIYGGGRDAFVAKFNPTGTSLLWGTYYGGTGLDQAWAMALDASDNVYITGVAASTSGIATAGAYQTVNGGGWDALVAKFDSNRTCSLTALNTTFTKDTLCTGDSTTLSVSAVGSATVKYLWQPGGLTTQTIHITPLATTTYTVTGSDTVGGCLMKDSVRVKVNPLPIIILSGAGNICRGDSTMLGASGGVSYTWSTGGTASSIVVKPASTTTYSVSVSNSSGCSKDTSVTVKVNSVPVASLSGISNVLCNGDANGAVAINVSAGTSPYTYSWSSGQTTSALTGLSAGTYTCTVSDSSGCSVTTTATITQPAAISLLDSATNTTCATNTGLAKVSGTGGTGSYTYMWSSGQTTSAITGLSAGTYTCTVSDSNGCTSTTTAVINNTGVPLATACCSTTISPGQTVILNVLPNSVSNTYSWIPATGLSCTTCTNPIASPTVTTWYYVTVTDSEGCSITDSVLITVKETCGSVYVPNAFSPNADGYNDVLYVYGNCIQTMQFRIYDRWGNKVFESDDPKIGWNGTFHGQPMNTGTYVYTLTVLDFNNNTTTKKGNIALVR